MLTVKFICVGNLREKYLKEAFEEYAKRLNGYCCLQVVEIDEYRASKSPSAAEISQILENEGAKILKEISRTSRVIAMCVEGKAFSSERLSDYIELITVGGVSSLSLIIGGSYGLSPEVKSRADVKMSMSCMTFPHQLARVMLCEQMYRAFSISVGGKYHK